MKEVCVDYGFDAVSPMDDAPGIPRLDYADPYTQACHTFAHWQQHVRSCDILLGNLNDFQGQEPCSDVSFECGMAWQLGKTCFGYMENTSVMRKRIPHYGADRNYKDICGNEVENFNYPVNLMFSSSMPVFEGDFEEVIKQVHKAINHKAI
jgi:nucleoside 2-deoxyribosyltransferase